MKFIANIARFILITILTICLISIGIITIVSSTILDKNYIISKLEETDFYTQIYNLIESNFENYIYQSGLEETALKNICSKEKVKQDINLMISNLYDGTNKQIDVTEIENNLNKNIDDLKVRNKQNEEAINQFVKHITDEYTNTLMHTKYENNINNMYNKITKILEKARIAILVVMVVDAILLLILNIKKISKFLQGIGITLLSSSLFEIIACNIVTKKVNIQGIKILNDAFSTIIVTVAQETINKIQSLGVGTLILSAILIIIYAVIKAISEKETNKRKDIATEE